MTFKNASQPGPACFFVAPQNSFVRRLPRLPECATSSAIPLLLRAIYSTGTGLLLFIHTGIAIRSQRGVYARAVAVALP